MTPKRQRILVLCVPVLLAGLLLPGRVGAEGLPNVKLGGQFFPGEFPAGTLYGCNFRLDFENFTAGQQASVAFRVFPPTSAKQGGDTVVSETFFLNGPNVTTSYNLRRTLAERFEPGGPGGFNVELAVHVTDGARPVFTGVGHFLVGNDCVFPLQNPTTTTSTTVPCGNCAAEPPRATLAGAKNHVAGVQGSHCWSPGAGRPATCKDSVFADPADVLRVTRGEVLSLRFATEEAPSEITLYRHDSFNTFQPVFAGPASNLPATNPTSFRADFPEGTHWLVVSSRWTQGSSITFFKVVVPSAQPVTAKPVVLALTG